MMDFIYLTLFQTPWCGSVMHKDTLLFCDNDLSLISNPISLEAKVFTK
uniref:Uncharacterized protein n=1 Tax=Rhizophora mucronata TaxID=61149 RepID=A0A2P2PTB6_RHIMU